MAATTVRCDHPPPAAAIAMCQEVDPENESLTTYLLLPAHLVVEVVELLEEVVDLTALVVPLGGGEDADLGLLRQVLADVRDGKHNLLHGAVVAYDLESRRRQGSAQAQTPSPELSWERRHSESR